MDFVKFFYKNSIYHYDGGNTLAMDILGCFLTSEVVYRPNSFKYMTSDKNFEGGTGNITRIAVEGNYFFISDLFSEEKIPTELKISRQQFVQLLDDWQEKVCDKRPKHVIIKHENNEFTIETSDEEFLV